MLSNSSIIYEIKLWYENRNKYGPTLNFIQKIYQYSFYFFVCLLFPVDTWKSGFQSGLSLYQTENGNYQCTFKLAPSIVTCYIVNILSMCGGVSYKLQCTMQIVNHYLKSVHKQLGLIFVLPIKSSFFTDFLRFFGK